MIAIMDPYGNEAALGALAKAGVTAFAMALCKLQNRRRLRVATASPMESALQSQRDGAPWVDGTK